MKNPDPNLYEDDESFELPPRHPTEPFTKTVPRHETAAYQGYFSELLAHLQEEYEETDRIDVTTEVPPASRRPRDVKIVHPAGSISDSIRNLTEDTRSARIVDIASMSIHDKPDGAKEDEVFIEIYLQPEVPEELTENERQYPNQTNE